MWLYKIKGVYKIMEKKVLQNYVKKGKLLAIVSPKTTFRKCYISWYVVKNNNLFHIDAKSSSVIGMNRVLDCYFKLLDKYNLSKLSNVQNYKIID